MIGKLAFLKPFQKYVPKRITHKYSAEMSKKSSAINLGFVFANESSGEGMVEILKFMHQYIHESNANEQVVFDGDQLTCERAVGVQRLRKTSIDKEQRLADVLPTAEDWHTKMTSLIVRTRGEFRSRPISVFVYIFVLNQSGCRKPKLSTKPARKYCRLLALCCQSILTFLI